MVQTISVPDTEVTVQAIPFSSTLMSELVVDVDRSALFPKPVPERVTVVPPAEVPRVGLMAVTVGVMLVLYVKLLASVAVGPPSAWPSPRTCRKIQHKAQQLLCD